MCVYSIRGYFCLRYLHSDRPNQWRHDRGIIPNDALGKRLKSSMRWVNEYQHLSITNIEHVEFFSWMILQLSLWPSIHSQCFLFLRIRSCSAYDIYIYILIDWLIDWLLLLLINFPLYQYSCLLQILQPFSSFRTCCSSSLAFPVWTDVYQYHPVS